MERTWTEAQLDAINARKDRLLISAAAGSGKTATLIERIIRSITNKESPMDISRMLVVTFTRPAAHELRQRVMQALTKAVAEDPENAFLNRQLLFLEDADIKTIDSFCFDVVKQEFYRSGADASFKLGSDGELSIISQKAMDEAIEAVLVAHHDRTDGKLYEFFSVMRSARSDSLLSEYLIGIHREIINVPEGIEYIKDHINELRYDSEKGDVSTRAKEVILFETKTLFEHIDKVLTGYSEYAVSGDETLKKYADTIEREHRFVRSILAAAEKKNYFEIKDKLTSFEFKKIPGIPKSEVTVHTLSFKDEHTAYIKSIRSLTENYYSYSKEDIRLLNAKSEDFLSLLYEIFSLYEKKIKEKKHTENILEFKDLKTEVYKLFVDKDGNPTTLAHEYSSHYDIIYIDEYQDVDPIQDRIFTALSCDCALFTVGDIKQSIYGFRGSEPLIFGARRNEYPPYEKDSKEACASIFMSNNFRCSKPIIEVSNHICSHLFRATNNCFGGVGYKDEDDLVFSKPATDSELAEFVIVGSDNTVDDDKDADASAYLPEVKYIASRILSMMTNGRKEDGSLYEWSDFAILCRRNKQVNIVSELLATLNVPADEPFSLNYFNSPEVLLLTSLFYAIDNPLKDIALSAILLSPVFSFTDSEMLEIRTAHKAPTVYETLIECSENGLGEIRLKCKNAIERLKSYSVLAHTRSVDEFISLLWSRLDLDAIASYASNDKRSTDMKRANMKKLYDSAMTFGRDSYCTLHSFLIYIDELLNAPEAKPNIPYSPDNGNKVHVLTMHKSKGLEFPVCFIFGTSYEEKKSNRKPDVIFESSVGISFDPAAENGLVKIHSPYKVAAQSRLEKKQNLEKIRVLYVALTRAKEKLIITASKTGNLEKLLEKYSLAEPSIYPYIDTETAFPVLSAKTNAEWILQCNIKKCPYIKVTFASANLFEESKANEKLFDDKKIKYNIDDAELYRRFSFVYDSPESKIPAKLAVSGLTPSILDENAVFGLQKFNRERSLDEIPSFADMSAYGPAQRGTATHLFLQFCSFENVEKVGVRDELSRLVNKGFLQKEHEPLINVKSLENFFRSDFYKKLKDAKKLYREQRFNMPLPAHIFSEISSKKKILRNHYVLVQGVIDLAFITHDDELILADYKTDYIDGSIVESDKAVQKLFEERYSRQLGYYALSCRRLFGKYPERIVIYSLSTAKEYDIEIDLRQFD